MQIIIIGKWEVKSVRKRSQRAAHFFSGFDLANHFLEHMFAYTLKEQPFYTVDTHNLPPHAHMRNFASEYLLAYGGGSGGDDDENEKEDADALVAEALEFVPM